MKTLLLLSCLLIGTLADYDKQWDPENPPTDAKSSRTARNLAVDGTTKLTELQTFLRSHAAKDMAGKSSVKDMVTQIEALMKPKNTKLKSEKRTNQNQRWEAQQAYQQIPVDSGGYQNQIGNQPHATYDPLHNFVPQQPYTPVTNPGYTSGIDHAPNTQYGEENSSNSQYSRLGVYEFKQLWLNMLYDVYQILNNETLLAESSEQVKTLETIFYLLNDIDIVDVRTKKWNEKCPYGFNKQGRMCLSGEFLYEYLSWEDARLYCQLVKGGDLVIFKDLNEYQQACKFVNGLSQGGKFNYSFWVGASDFDNEGLWKFVDGTKVPLKAGLWGTRKGKLEPTGGYDQNYALLLYSDYYYMHDVDNDLAIHKLYPQPLCQYIPERDGYLEVQKKPSGLGPYSAFDPWTADASSGNRPYSASNRPYSGSFAPWTGDAPSGNGPYSGSFTPWTADVPSYPNRPHRAGEAPVFSAVPQPIKYQSSGNRMEDKPSHFQIGRNE